METLFLRLWLGTRYAQDTKEPAVLSGLTSLGWGSADRTYQKICWNFMTVFKSPSTLTLPDINAAMGFSLPVVMST